jgi:hypothetical protein
VPYSRLVAILELLAQGEDRAPHGGLLCSVATQITGLSGASVVLTSSAGQMTGFCSSDGVAASLMELEVTVGAGPCVDACRTGSAVFESDLALSRREGWLAYTPDAVARGAGAVFAFPLRLGAVTLGALALYRRHAGTLSDAQESDSYLMASVVGRAVLALQARAVRGSLASELESEASFDFVVHQAAGMVAVQGSLSLGDALVVLRSHAFASSCGLSEMAGRVVARQLRYDRTTDSWLFDRGPLAWPR